MAPAKKASAKKTSAKKSAKKTADRASSSAKKTARKASGTAKKTARKASGSAKRAAKKATRTASAATTGNVVVASQVKEAVKRNDVRMSSEFVEALNEEVAERIEKATQRAKDNNRSTVRPSDL